MKAPSIRSKAATALSLVCVAASALYGCSDALTPVDEGGSVVLADLGPQNNELARKQADLFASKLDPAFTKPEPGTQTMLFTGFRKFGGGQQNVSGEVVTRMAKEMTTGPTESRSVEGGTLTRGIVERDGKKYTAYFFEGDTNYATTPLIAASVAAIKPNAVVSLGQGPKTEIEIGSSGTATTSYPGYDSKGNLSTNFAKNNSSFIDENDRKDGQATTTLAPKSIEAFAKNTSLPLAAKVDPDNDYLCSATAWLAKNLMDGKTVTPLPGVSIGGKEDNVLIPAQSARNAEIAAAAAESGAPIPEMASPTLTPNPTQGVVGFVHLKQEEYATADQQTKIGANLFDSAAKTIPQSVTPETKSEVTPNPEPQTQQQQQPVAEVQTPAQPAASESTPTAETPAATGQTLH